ncbi:PadR family transcriptional regulator [Georgenia sp. EYE_87]|uniref:PadR family transcriptional regulator n=1 Tax=Georgenia sp. EYE_87 TaxID=2853448 RepID=UPI00200525E8|nr:PadR family transcriptional regulator [Georgenia sp. EYE_87]MCK6212238.1 PadR family transcriptional regulator [Georgenia sp. EYE_87]
MSLKYAVLEVLQASPTNGYRLARRFAEAQRWVWSAPQSQVYGVLAKLREDGLIAGTLREGDNGLSTADYALTPEGDRALAQWISAPHPEPPTRDPFALQALGFDSIDTDSAVAVLEAHVAEQGALIKQWEEHRDALLRRDTPLLRERLKIRPVREHRRIAEVKAMVFARQVELARVKVDWARRMIDLLRALDVEVTAPGVTTGVITPEVTTQRGSVGHRA